MYSKTIARQVIVDARASLLSALRTFRDIADADLAALRARRAAGLRPSATRIANSAPARSIFSTC